MTALPRRGFLGLAMGALGALASFGFTSRTQPMNRFGLHGKLLAPPGQRDTLAQLLLDGTRMVATLPGCEMYIVSLDEKDANAIYVTEVWKTEADHTASLQMPEIRAIIEKGRPMVAGFGDSSRMVTLGGHGLS